MCQKFGSSSHSSIETSEASTNLFANFYLVATPAGKQNAVTGLHAGRHDLALLVRCTRTYGNDSGLGQRVRRRRRGDEDTSRGFLEVQGTRNVSTFSGEKIYREWTRTVSGLKR